ncbi:IbrB-like domain-containing protein [Enterobacter cloacae]|uniref:IbrB-like domain-containing protein n=1 Tax=Enterobacter cloacae TaxID=550 RepID=UPI00115D50A3|nr:ParB/RepB/Spo0J family partition protein [Enterobacter cloacae]
MELTSLTEQLLHHLGQMVEVMDDGERAAVHDRLQTLMLACSTFQHEPVSAVRWVPCESLKANDYNPNKMAPPESKLLVRSLAKDGFTQPLVVYRTQHPDRYIIIDGFHRHHLASENPVLRKRFKGYVPVVILEGKPGEVDNMATTVRHNRARGQHQIQLMSELVKGLVLSGWDDQQIADELGMEADEVLRLKQLNGLYELFRERAFSKAWTV